MTQQDDIIQRLNEIHADAGYLFGRAAADGACAGAMAESVRTKIDAVKTLLSKLRAPVADERAAFEANFPVPVHCQWIGNGYASTDYNAWDAIKHKTRWEGWQARAALASAPVAGEAQPVAWANDDGDPISDAMKRARLDLYSKHYTRPLYAAPQASADQMQAALQKSFDMGKFYGSLPETDAEDVCNAALEEAAHLMEQTGKRIAAADIRALKQPQAAKDEKTRDAVDYPRGGALNFDAAPPVRAEPTTYTTRAGESVMGVALRELGNEMEWRHILACNPQFADLLPHEYFPVGTVLTLPQADKDGGQQRAGDDCKHARVYRAGDRQGYACPDCGEFVSDYEIHRRQRSALSATQAEQGERDAD